MKKMKNPHKNGERILIFWNSVHYFRMVSKIRICTDKSVHLAALIRRADKLTSMTSFVVGYISNKPTWASNHLEKKVGRVIRYCSDLWPWSSWTANSDKKCVKLNGAALNVNKPCVTSRRTTFPKDKEK